MLLVPCPSFFCFASTSTSLLSDVVHEYSILFKSDHEVAQPGTFNFIDENVHVFRFSLGWLHHKKLEYTRDENDSLAFLIDADVLAERRGTQAFHNAIVKGINLTLHPAAGTVLDVVDCCLRVYHIQFEAARRLVVDKVAWEE